MSVAQSLERAGLTGVAELARRARWGIHVARSVSRPTVAARLTGLWLLDRLRSSPYQVLNEAELRATRRSDTVFIFGAGRSLLDISEEEWQRIAQHDTAALSHFHQRQFVRVDYHMIAELLDAEETARSIAANPCYRDTVFLVMKGWLAEKGNAMIGRRLLPTGARVFRFRRRARGRVVPPSRLFARGLVHGVNSSVDITNFALLMGWRRIVLVGVDLYNKEYFFLPPGVAAPGEPPWITASSRFPGAGEIVATFRLFREHAERDGVELLIYNPRSLLADVLPTFTWVSLSSS